MASHGTFATVPLRVKMPVKQTCRAERCDYRCCQYDLGCANVVRVLKTATVYSGRGGAVDRLNSGARGQNDNRNVGALPLSGCSIDEKSSILILGLSAFLLL